MLEEWIKEVLLKIEHKVDNLDSRVDNVDVTLAKQSVILDEHIKRTTLAEENISLLREEMKPIHKHVDQVHTVLKIVGLIATLATIGEGIVRIIAFIQGKPIL